MAAGAPITGRGDWGGSPHCESPRAGEPVAVKEVVVTMEEVVHSPAIVQVWARHAVSQSLLSWVELGCLLPPSCMFDY